MNEFKLSIWPFTQQKRFFFSLSLAYRFWKHKHWYGTSLDYVDPILQTLISKCSFLMQDICAIGIDLNSSGSLQRGACVEYGYLEQAHHFTVSEMSECLHGCH